MTTRGGRGEFVSAPSVFYPLHETVILIQILSPIMHSLQAVSSADQILKKNNRTEEQSQTEKASQDIIRVPLSDSVPLYA
jgi:hypothetical protein